MTDDAANTLAVSIIPAFQNYVEYYRTITRTALLTNEGSCGVLVEEVTLRFQSDRNEASLLVPQIVGTEIEVGKILDVTIEITPTALYLANTNVFDVEVRFRKRESGQLRASQKEVFSSRAHILVKEPRDHRGRVFISIKQPDDEPLGRRMELLARRVGLVPFLKASNLRPGQDLWSEVIEPNLLASDVVLVLWTEKTGFTDGVRREVRFCRRHRLKLVLLLQDGQPIPDVFADASKEIVWFDRNNPSETFVTVLAALRDSLFPSMQS